MPDRLDRRPVGLHLPLLGVLVLTGPLAADYSSAGEQGSQGVLHYMVNGQTHSSQREWAEQLDPQSNAKLWVEMSRNMFVDGTTQSQTGTAASATPPLPLLGDVGSATREDAATADSPFATNDTPYLSGLGRRAFRGPFPGRRAGAARSQSPASITPVSVDVAPVLVNGLVEVHDAADNTTATTNLLGDGQQTTTTNQPLIPTVVDVVPPRFDPEGGNLDPRDMPLSAPAPGGLVLVGIAAAALFGFRRKLLKQPA
jgi:hypothetical protein